MELIGLTRLSSSPPSNVVGCQGPFGSPLRAPAKHDSAVRGHRGQGFEPPDCLPRHHRGAPDAASANRIAPVTRLGASSRNAIGLSPLKRGSFAMCRPVCRVGNDPSHHALIRSSNRRRNRLFGYPALSPATLPAVISRTAVLRHRQARLQNRTARLGTLGHGGCPLAPSPRPCQYGAGCMLCAAGLAHRSHGSADRDHGPGHVCHRAAHPRLGTVHQAAQLPLGRYPEPDQADIF